MSEAIERARAIIENGLAELESERSRLHRALADLDSASGRTPAHSRRATRNGGRRARRGQRREEFLKAVGLRAGEPVSVLAQEIGVPPQQLYPIARKLHAEELIVKHDRGFALAPIPASD